MKNALFGGITALTLVFASSAWADFEFELDVEGDGNLQWEYELQEDETSTYRSGAEFTFNGGAGASGEVLAKGQWADVAGTFNEYAYGSGDAYSNTRSGNYGQSEFHAGSEAMNSGYATDFAGGSSRITYDSVATAGGSGSAMTGLTYGYEHSRSQEGAGWFDYDLGLEAEGGIDN